MAGLAVVGHSCKHNRRQCCRRQLTGFRGLLIQCREGRDHTGHSQISGRAGSVGRVLDLDRAKCVDRAARVCLSNKKTSMRG